MALISQNMFVALLFLVMSAFQYGTCKSKSDYFDEVPKELRCSGCELTVKVLNQMLVKAKPSHVEKFVEIALKEVCTKERFTISEYKADSMVKTCKYMRDSHGQELKQELIKHYSKSKNSSYMELSQQICLNIIRLCPGLAHRMPEDDASMGHFNHFLKISGMDAKVVKPVPRPASHDEL